MSGLREALELQSDPSWPANTALHTEEARQYFLRLVSRCLPLPPPSSWLAGATDGAAKLHRRPHPSLCIAWPSAVRAEPEGEPWHATRILRCEATQGRKAASEEALMP